MSGGVDSSVAALLLKKEGYDVTGVFMKNWSDPLANECPWKKDLADFHDVCKILQIPGRIEVFEAQYQKKVVQYMIEGYKKGITPNPDMLCNREIKFKVFLEKARALGADYIATGHYVRKKRAIKGKRKIFKLLQAIDLNKDQSYFIALLNQRQLRYSLFPIGNYTKPAIRKIAKKAKLPVHNKKDSQGICFIGKVKFKEFIREYIEPHPGIIKDTNGAQVGRHDGLMFYTIGQRHGLGIGGGKPYFVVEKNKRSNRLIVGIGNADKKLFKEEAKLINMHWIAGCAPKLPYACKARIRYRQPLQGATIEKKGNGIIIRFKKRQRAVTPGQFAVLYKKGEMIGGGAIV